MINQGAYWWIRGGGTNCEAQYLFQLKPETFVSCHFPSHHFLSTLPYLLLSTLPTHTMCQLFGYSPSISSSFLTSKANLNLCLMSRPLGACRSGYITTYSVRDILESTNNSMLCRFIIRQAHENYICNQLLLSM